MEQLARWIGRAACAGMETDLFFPHNWNERTLKLPRQTCAGCPVRQECLEWALAEFIDYGMFGGLTQEERARLRKELRMVKPRWIADYKPHGSEAAFVRHMRAGEPPCELCRVSKTERDRERNTEYKRRARAERIGA